jgi:hypothetical protein
VPHPLITALTMKISSEVVNFPLRLPDLAPP